MNNPSRYLITAALPYANGPVHIGHLAGCYLPADIYVRYLRAQKRDVKFIGGSDEHGVPITIRAMKEGITPQQVVDRTMPSLKKAWSRWAFHLTSIPVLPIKCIMKRLLHFLKSCMMMVCLKRKKQNSILMRRQIRF